MVQTIESAPEPEENPRAPGTSGVTRVWRQCAQQADLPVDVAPDEGTNHICVTVAKSRGVSKANGETRSDISDRWNSMTSGW